MTTQPETAVKQRVLIATLTLKQSTMAYRVFKDFIEHNSYYDGELEIIHRAPKLPPTVQITFDYKEEYQAQVLKAIDLAQTVLQEHDVKELVEERPDSKYFVYEAMHEEAMDYISELLPYGFLRNSPGLMNNPVQSRFRKWFFDLPPETDLDELADKCVSKYMDLLLSHVNSGKNGAVGWKPDFQ